MEYGMMKPEMTKKISTPNQPLPAIALIQLASEMKLLFPLVKWFKQTTAEARPRSNSMLAMLAFWRRVAWTVMEL